MDNAPHGLLLEIDSQIRFSGCLIRVVDAREALDLSPSGLGINAALVSLLAVLERRGDVHEEEGSGAGNGLAGLLSALLVRGNWRGDDSGTGLGELSGNEGDALDVLVTILAREAKFGRELVADGVT